MPYFPHIITGILTLLGLGFSWLKGKGWIKAEFLTALETDVGSAVNLTYQEYVKARKAANEDGKLTEEEKKQARDLAIDKLKAIGKDKGKNYAKTWIMPVALNLVERWVNRKKDGQDK